MIVYKYDPGIILRPVILIFLLVTLLYWLGKLPGALSPAEKKEEASCNMVDTAPLTAQRTFEQGGEVAVVIASGAGPAYSHIPNYSQVNGHLTHWHWAKITPVGVYCQEVYCRLKQKKIIFVTHMKKILKREIRQLLKSTRLDKGN